MIAVALGMFLGVAALFSYLQPSTRRRLVGYGLWLDLAVWTVFLVFFGGTGLERMGAIFASMGVTAFIHTYKYFCGYEKYTRNGWTRYAGRLAPR